MEAIAWALRSESVKEEKEREEPSAPHQAQRTASRPLHVLLAEDGLVNQQVAVGLLELAGHQVVVAGNGREAVSSLEKQTFDVVLMDVQMPEMDGLEATAAIRKREKKSGGHIPIIAMTAHAMKGDREICLAAGMDGYLTKPILAEAMYDALDKLVPTIVEGERRRATGKDDAVSSPATIADMPVLDWEMAIQRVSGRPEFLVKMIELFFKECGRLMPEIRTAIDRRDAPGLWRGAHTLKGSADCFAARPVVESAQRLETIGRDSGWNGVEEAWVALQREVDRLVPALEAHLKDAAAP